MNDRITQLKEIARIMKDTPYALRTYLETYDNTQKKFVPFELFPEQINLIHDLENYNENITKKYRQAGITTVTAGWISKKMILADEKQPEKVLIVANKKDTAVEMANKIKAFLYQWPDWINPGFDPDKNSESRFRLLNGCEVKAVATSKDALRGFTPTILIFDEAAYIDAGEDFWAACMASLSTGGKVILISCVTKDTFVFTDNGLQQVKDFVRENQNIGEGYIIDDYNIQGKDKTRKSNLILNNGTHPTLKIKTIHSNLEGTLSHKLWAFSNETNEYGWYQLKDLKVGDYVSVGYGFEKWGSDDLTNFIYTPSQKENNVFIPTKITTDLAYLFGLFIAEGSSYKRYNDKNNFVGGDISITCGDDLSEFFNKLGVRYTLYDKLHYKFSSKSLYSLFEHLGFDLSKKAVDKIIPSRLLRMSRENIVAMLQGIFDGDGWSDQSRMRLGISLSSKILIDQIRMLLLNFGILTDYQFVRMRPTKKVKSESNSYRIACSSKYSEIFYDKIGFRFNRKQIKRNIYNYYNINRVDSFDIIPNGVNIIKNILQENHIPRKRLSEDLKKIYDSFKRNKNLSRISFGKMIKFFIEHDIKVDDKILSQIYYANSKWDRIKDISHSENETFDFSLYNDELDFWCHSIYYNGLLGHQTPNGFDPIYYAIYEQAVRKVNDFKITELSWYNDPRYSKDLRWLKVDDLVHYMLNRSDYNDDEITVYDVPKEKYKEYIEQGYKPFSTWYENMSKKFKYDKRKIAQELECVDYNTIVTVRDKFTSEIKKIRIGDLYDEF